MSFNDIYSEDSINELRFRIKTYLSEKRYSHTLGVEKEAAELSHIFLPEKENKLRAAALLHDITKCMSIEKQLKYCTSFDIISSDGFRVSDSILHSKSALFVIQKDFPEFADKEILSAVSYHSTGRENMTLFEGIIYLSDFIEEGRTFESCLYLREYFYNMLNDKNILPLTAYYKAMVKSFDITVSELIKEGAKIDSDTIRARNYFINKITEITN